jgi:gliding motility-associated-like protein
MKNFLLIRIVIISSVWVYAQNPDIKRTWHWYFGNGAGLDFSSGFPVADTTGKLHSYESCAVMSDTAGNLLFYTDGDTVWDNNHNIYVNGTGLMGCGNNNNSSAQGALIVPHPGNDSLYYIFTSDCFENAGVSGYRYTLVDAKNKQVLQKNVLLYAPSTEGMAITRHANGVDYWFVTHEYNSNKFIVYKIDDTLGIVFNNPIISNIGPIIIDYLLCIRISPDGKKLTCVPSFTNYDPIYQFDNSCGKVYNEIKIYDNYLTGSAYYAVFSIDNSKIYFTYYGSFITQYELCSLDSVKINKSRNLIAYQLDNSSFGQMQIGPDNKIYIASLFSDFISTIVSPNNSGENVGFFYRNFYLYGRKSLLGLPLFCESFFNSFSEKCNIINDFSLEYSNLSIPNIFTPNADNTNDYFSIQISGYTNIEYFIYNRWGNLIHQGKKELNPEIKTEERLWDGRYKGNEVPAGVYFFLIKAIKMNGEEEIKKGFIQLLR